jgi:signal peptidase I
LRNGQILVDGKQTDSYQVQRDYVFGMGDNRDNSLDSRFWGFIPMESIVGTPLIVYWSWNPDISLFNLSDKLPTIRWGRLGTLVK